MKDSLPKNSAEFNPLEIYGNTGRIKRIFYIFTVVILMSLGAGVVITILWNDTRNAAILCGGMPLALLGVPFISKSQFEKAAGILSVILLLLITLIATEGLGIHHISNLGFPAVLIIASLVVRKRALITLTIFATACVAWLVFGELAGLYTPEVLVRSVPGDFVAATITLFATAIITRTMAESLYQGRLEVHRELKERKRVEERLAYDALHDALTELPNRTLFYDRLGQRLEYAHRHPQDLFAVLFIDLDRFKVVNDSLGHTVGDQLLIETARRLTQCLRTEDTVSRLGGDEFAILLNNFVEVSDAVRVAERIQAELTSSSMIQNVNRVTTASIGITVFNGSYANPQEMLRDADSAMYRAKSMGRGRYVIFDDTMYASAMALLQLEADLKRAVENREWQVYYQPIVTVPDREIIGVEALVRWLHPQRGIIGPAEFIHVAEETGLIVPIGEYVLREACKNVKAWRDNGRPGLWVSVNLSVRQLQDQNLFNTIEKIMTEIGLSGDALHLEITESIAMSDSSNSAQVLNSLNSLGIRISLDDFGNGYSSLAYINRFPIKTLKIGRSFIRDVAENRNSEAIATAIISMSHALSMEVTAQGVETEGQLAFLQSSFCDNIQGHLISPAVSAEQLELLLSSKMPDHDRS